VGKDKAARVDPPAITFVANGDDAVLTIVYQRAIKNAPAFIRDFPLRRMPCGHFCSYPMAGNGRCCGCAKTPACVVMMQGFARS